MTRKDVDSDGLRVLDRPESHTNGHSTPMAKLPSPSDIERLRFWNGRATPAQDLRVHDLIQERIISQPGAPAVCAWDGNFTYQELDELSSRLASQLIARGVKPETFVALCFPKSKWTAVSILAVVKSGAAFVLLFDGYPIPRLREIYDQVNATVLLAAPELIDYAKQLSDDIVFVGEGQSLDWPHDVRRLKDIPITGNSALYAIFTSGSTGKPKGAVNEHASLCVAAQASGEALGMSAQSRVFQFASYSFDPTIMDFLRTFIFGACVCIPSSDQARNDIVGAINQLKATHASMTPSVARILDPDRVQSLQALELAGEPMLETDRDRWCKRLRLVNAYGIAECAVYSVLRLMSNEISPRNIGFGAGCTPWVVDEEDHNSLLPIGEIGELLLEGPTIGRGYINDQQKTDNAFVNGLPWLEEFRGDEFYNSRIYKTGDLVQYQPDGSLMGMGRKDMQAKIRGQRIELGEVEHHMSGLLNPHEEVVVEVIHPDGGHRENALLVAFVRLHAKSKFSPSGDLFALPTDTFRVRMEDIERQLKGRVPAFMVPGAFVGLNWVPLLSSGKTNRRQLREQASCLSRSDLESYMRSATAHVSPTNQIEKTLQEAFVQVLGLPANELSIHDSFFRRGGDSISAMQLSAHCRTRGFPVQTQDIFQYSTIQMLGQYILAQGDDAAASFHLTPAQRSMLPTRTGQDLPAQSIVYRLESPLTLGQLESTVQYLMGRHPNLRTRYTAGDDGQWTQAVAALDQTLYECSDLQLSELAELDRLRDAYCNRLNITDGPLLLAYLGNGDDGNQSLLLVAPTVTVDPHSWYIILSDVKACLQGHTPPQTSGSFQAWLEDNHEVSQYSLLTASNPTTDVNGIVSEKLVSSQIELDQSTTALLYKSSETGLRTTPEETLLGSLVHTFVATFPDQEHFEVWIQRNGRTLKYSEVVGQFTTHRLLEFSSVTNQDMIGVVRQTKDALRTSSGNPRRERTTETLPKVIFVWHDKLEDLPITFHGSTLQSRFKALWAITAYPSTDSVTLRVTYSHDLNNQVDIQYWLQQWLALLTEGLKQLATLPVQLTIGDFPRLAMDSSELMTLVDASLAQHQVEGQNQIEDIYPTSFIQQGMLLSQARDPLAYCSSTAWEIRSTNGSTVDLGRLQDAWQQVVSRHSVLRTVFVLHRDGCYYQTLLKSVPLPIRVLPSNAPESIQVAQKEAGGFSDFATLLPWALTLGPLSRGSVVCELKINHALMDGESMWLLVRDVQRAYDGQLPSQLPPSYSQYVDYLNHVPRTASLQYWGTYLGDTEPCLFPSFAGTFTNGQGHSLTDQQIEIQDIPQLLSFCENEGLTLFNLIQLAWAMVLQCYVGTDTVCFGYLTSGRDVPIGGVQDLVGPLINMLIARIDLTDGLTVRQHLAQNQDRFVQSLPHQHCSLTEIYRALGQSGAALFNTLITYQRIPPNGKSSIAFDEIHDVQPTEFDIVLNVKAHRRTVDVSFTYLASKLPSNLATSIAGSFSTVLGEIVARPDLPVSGLNMLSKSDHAQIMSWNTPALQVVSTCMHELVYARCLEHPGKPAVCAWDGSLTYQELWDNSSILAQHLADCGIDAEMPVPICMFKSVWSTVSMLAVLRAGGICILIDPDAPVERIHSMMTELAPTVILVCPETADMDFASHAERIVASWTSSAGLRPLDLRSRVQPHNAAFIIYTSGSTGRPKGIILRHDSLSTSMLEHGYRMNVNSNTRGLQFASYAFDMSVYETFTTLTYGGCVCIPSDHAKMNDLTQFIADAGINWVAFTPSMIRVFHPDDIPSVQTVVLLGEALPQDLADIWAGRVMLFNAYGPAECTICAVQPVELTGHWVAGTVGRPVGGSGWIVDTSNMDRPMPVGAIGELLFAGPVVARTYLDRPEDTLAAFLTSHPSWLPQLPDDHRLYRTGDLMRYNPDGSMRYIGRKDRQIKLRGQRIELEEIEGHIRRHLSPGQNVVVDVISPTDQKRTKVLIAFIWDGISRDETCLIHADDSFRSHSETIRSQLQTSIPNYMIPQLMIPISTVPKTKSSKTDRGLIHRIASRLARMQLEALVVAEGRKAQPTTQNESVMRGMWATALDLSTSQIGIRDQLFQLGGDSITAMRIVSLARAQKYNLSVADVFSRPILADLAERLQKQMVASSQEYKNFSLVVPEDNIDSLRETAIRECSVPPSQIEDIYPCTALQEGLMSLSIKQQGSYLAQYLYRIDDGVDLDLLAASWNAVVQANPILRTRIFQAPSGQIFQAVLKNGASCEVLPSDHDLEQYMKTAKSMRIGLGTELLQSAICSRSGDAYWVLTIHHTVYDGWSKTRLLEQLEAAYAGHAPQLQPFTGFIKYLCEQDVSATKTFWESEFANLDCEVFPPRSSQYAETSALQLVEHSFHAPSISSSVTMSAIVRLAWGLVVSKYTDSQDVVFGATVAGRSAAVDNIEQMAGPTIATVPFRVQISPSMSVEAALQEVQSRTIAMIPYEATGIHRIRRLGDKAAAACQFRNLLVIQQEQSFYQPRMVHEVERFSDNIAAINTYPLTILSNLNKNNVHLQVSFDPRILSHPEIRVIVQQLEGAILQLVQKHSQSISDIDLAGPETIEQLQEWNKSVPNSLDVTLNDLISPHFESRPQSQAVCSWDGDMTYGELDQTSARLADVLVQEGVKEGVLVPVYMDKCKWALVSILGVMRAGGAFVLMDPAQPLERSRQIQNQVDGPLLLTTTYNTQSARALASNVVLVDNQDWEAHPGQTAWRTCNVQPRDILYSVFTSGTTGTPKGVLIEHGAFATSVSALVERFGLDNSTRLLQYASYTFDVSVLDLLSTLVAGGCLCIPSRSDRQSNLAHAVQSLNANFMHLTPSVAELIQPDDVCQLRTLVLSGEAMTPGLVKCWAERVRLINAYGPAECSVDCSVNSHITYQSNPYDIGRASGCVLWVVDKEDHNRLAPLNTVGELLVEGPILARGYLNDAEKTAAAFIEDPSWMDYFQSTASRRLYKTGDLVRYQPDGSLLYTGRKDTQIKLHGQRIELGDVEHHVKGAFDDARRVAVELVTSSSEDQNTALMAFIEFDTHSHESTPQLLLLPASDVFRAHVQSALLQLRRSLPAAMVPAAFFPVSQIPLSQSGKADRQKLRLVASNLQRSEIRSYMAIEKARRAPTTAAEKVVQTICCRLLKVPVGEIGMDDTFFEHGGDSISAIRLVAAAREAGWKMEVSDVFNEPTLTALAAIIRRGESTTRQIPPFSLLRNTEEVDSLRSQAVDICSLSHDQILDIYPATALQEGLLTLSFKQRGAYIGHFPLQLSTDVDIDRLKIAWKLTVDTNAILRTRLLQSSNGQLYQVVVKDEVEWKEAQGLDSYLENQANFAIRLGGSLSQVAIVQCPQRGCCFLVVTLHHALYDGWSIPLIFQDLENAYYGRSLPVRPFNGFIEYINCIDHTALRDFWTAEFNDLSYNQFPALPSAHYVPSVTNTMNHSVGLTDGPSNFTMSTVVRLAWAMVLSSYTGSNDVVFGATVAGRSASVPFIEEMTGPTVATVPIRIKIDPCQRTEDFMQSLQRHSTNMVPFEQAGLQSIRGFSPESAAACQFQSLLVIQGQAEEKAQSSDLFHAVNDGYDARAFSTYAINITCELAPSSIDFYVDFDSRVIEPGTMRMMLLQLAHASTRILNGCSLIGDLGIISPDGMQYLADLNSVVPKRVDCCVHDLVLAYSKETPDAVAVEAWDGVLTYRKLDELSAAFARSLVSLNIKTDDIVPLLCTKSVSTAIALLGVMRAGGAFLLLDPNQPTVRLQALCADVGANVVVASKGHTQLAHKLAAMVIECSVETIALSDPLQPTPLPVTTSKQLLYCVFTSGSTGRPKGVMVEHGSFCTSASKVAEVTPFNQSTRLFQFASFMFDVSITDHLMPLMYGGCIYIPSNEQVQNSLPYVLKSSQANYVELTPSVSRMIDPTDQINLKILALSGEAMMQGDVDRWHRHVKLINAYGPAECSAASTIKTGLEPGVSQLLLGEAAGCVCWVVDPDCHERVLPPGAIGELLIEGPIVGRGYVNDPAQTAAVFMEQVPWLDKFRGGTASRVYKTGDIVQQQLPNGELKYIGRKDTQVKVRGQRIELGEVEYQVQRLFDGATNVAAEVLSPSESQTILTVFVEIPPSGKAYEAQASRSTSVILPPDPSFHAQVKSTELRLRGTVPSYMVPSLFLPVNHIPLSVSGKVNRMMLREMATDLYPSCLGAYLAPVRPKRAPETEMQKTLQILCGKVLNLAFDKIGLDDSFLSLGGDSISAMSLVARASAQSVRTTVQDVLKCTSIESLALSCKSTTTRIADYGEQADVPFALSPIQRMFFEVVPPKCQDHYNQSFSVCLSERFPEAQLHDAIQDLVRRHSMLRARFSQHNGQWVQTITNDVASSYSFQTFDDAIDETSIE